MEYSRTEELSATVRTTVCLTWRADRFSLFSPLLQQGFMLRARLNESISNVLCGQFGLSSQYLRERINTIFLDGKPVDDVDSAMIKDKSVLALSAAMPGFVGAAFRKGGFYAAMRREITYVEDQSPGAADEGYFFLKLYNMVSTELAPLFLNAGILLESSDLDYFLRQRSESFWSGCMSCRVNDKEIPLDSFRERNWLTAGLVQFKVVWDGEREKE